MDSLVGDEGSRFFDAEEDIASTSESNFDHTEIFDSNSTSLNNWIEEGECSFQYDLWRQRPLSVNERRRTFLRWMGLSFDQVALSNPEDMCSDVIEGDSDRLGENTGVSDNSKPIQDFGYKEEVVTFEDSNAGRFEMAEDSEKNLDTLPPFQKLMETEVEKTNNLIQRMTKIKQSWCKLRSLACIVDSQAKNGKLGPENDSILKSRVKKVKVRLYKKQSKELSALFMGQDIQAHEGAILAMKFSHDGRYLASGGEDGVVRLWQVMEDERSNKIDISEIDPSSIYFTVNCLSELKPLFVEKEKIGKRVSLRKNSGSACVIFPPKVFRILEKPVHEFYGHSGEILDLSWSSINYLLSSSVDKTVRLWRVGYKDCLKVFSHSNYVTSVQFNPVNDDYFISGSIDGKVRIWGISCGQVVDWTDIREIITAVCYRPDGQGGSVGSMSGNCFFYNISDNSHLQLYAQICLHNKKKSPFKKITGFQFYPQDSSKLMVTCADSRVRILHGLNVIEKYKGLRNAGSQISASFTLDGKHIISACGDSNVCIWNYNHDNGPIISQGKKIKSYEHLSTNASIAIPWCGFKHDNSEDKTQPGVLDNKLPETLPSTSPSCFSLSQEFFLDSSPKGSATWPEEKLPTSIPVAKLSQIHKSRYKFLKVSCQNTSTSHAWGLVIVTAGWDGRIRSFHNYGLPIAV